MRKLTDEQRSVAQEACGLGLLAAGLTWGLIGLTAVGAWFLLPFLIRALRGA